MSDLGKIRAGSPRVYRDRVFGRRGECIAWPGEHSVDGLVRFVLHPDDIDEELRLIAEANVADLEGVIDVPPAERWTVYGLRIVGPGER